MLGLIFNCVAGPSWVLTLALAPATVATLPRPTLQDSNGITGEGFLLSKNPDFSTDDRTFTRTDRIYVRLWNDQIELDSVRKRFFTLSDDPGNSVRRVLAAQPNGSFQASFALADLPSEMEGWVFDARLEDRAGNRLRPSAEIIVAPSGPGPGPVAPPVANFAALPTSGEAPLSVNFSDLSSGAPTAWAWDFGDGGTSTLQNPSHVYSAAGTFSVGLTATNAGGASSSTRAGLVRATDPVATPVADFVASTTSGTLPLAVAFVETSTGPVTSWSWNFGDGSTSTARNPNHTYTAAGTYTVSMTVSGPGGADTLVRAGHITASEPSTQFLAFDGFESDSFDGGTGSWVGAWSRSGDVRIVADDAPHSGTHEVRLRKADASLGRTCDLLAVSGAHLTFWSRAERFEGSDHVQVRLALDGGPQTRIATITQTDTDYRFHDIDLSTFSVTSNVLIEFVSNMDKGRLFIDDVEITGTGPNPGPGAGAGPVADFSASPAVGEVPLSVGFTDLSTGAPTAWAWDFGDGATSTLQNPSHVFVTAGTFSVSLTATNASGASTSAKPGFVTVAAPGGLGFAIQYGMNSSFNGWSQRAIPFADAMARASEFTRFVNGQLSQVLAPIIPLGQIPARLGEGWPDFFALEPGELPGANLFNNMNGSTPDGRVTPYVLTWEGTGSCRLEGLPVVSEANRTPNRVEVFIDPTAGAGQARLSWVMEVSLPSDPVRNVHVWLPGTEATKPILWKPYVDKVQAMNRGLGPHTWRTLDWNQVNRYGATVGSGTFVFDLAGRITPASPSQGTRRGVCPQFQVELCNVVGANLHFLVPHRTDQMSDADYDTFLRDALTVIRDGSPAVPGVNAGQPFKGLAPELTVTLELSNEIWNTGFPVFFWMQSQAAASGMTLHQQIAMEIDRVFSIARGVFSGPDAPRLRTYVGGHVADSNYLQKVLLALDAGTHVDAIGCAAYFSPRPADTSGWLVGASPGNCPNCPTPLDVIAAGRQSISELSLLLRAHRQLARTILNADGTSRSFAVYEAGQHFLPGFQPWGEAAIQAQRHPDMFDAYVSDLVPMLVAEQVDVVNWYSFIYDNGTGGGADGPFGHWDNMNQSITLPVPDPYLDEGVPKAAAIYKGPPLSNP